MTDARKPPGGRLPLPPPADESAAQATYGGGGDVTSELPRLPEVELHEDASEVRVDPRSLAPARSSLTGARAHRVPQVLGEQRTRTIRDVGPRMPDRSPGPREITAQRSTLIGGRYHIVSRIGQGGMGKVYKVTHAHLSRTFALKIISSQVAETDEARELFYREARFASAMSHANITAVVDFGEDEKVGMFMVMEYVEGEPLHRVLFREKQMSVRKACEIVLQVAEALHYIHRQNVVHCDIKTENILISEADHDGHRSKMHVKLLDFGLARSLTSRGSTSLSGTPHYVAPERIRGQAASPASDVYGVGILLYELITGQVPWDGPVSKILSGHLEQMATPPSELVSGGVDAALERLIFRALEKQPSERHRDMAAFIYELRTVMEMLGVRRRARAGPTRRVLVERVSDTMRRDELARLTFDACRLPLALVTPAGIISVANPAFAKFVMGVVVEVEGLPIRSTPLAGAWSSWEDDLQRTVAGDPIRRVIEVDVAPGEVRRLLLWLDAVSPEKIVLGVQPLEL